MSVIDEITLRLTKTKDDAPCRQLVKKVESWGPNVFGQGRLIDNDVVLNVRCVGTTQDQVYFNIMTLEDARGKGKASEVLDRFLAAADDLGVTVVGETEPFGRQKGLTKSQLRKWYKKHGFVSKGGRDTIYHYPPQSVGEAVEEQNVLYHVTYKENILKIETDGIRPQKKLSGTGMFGQDVRKDKKAIYAFDNELDAIKWAFDMNKYNTEDNARIITFRRNPNQGEWEQDPHVQAQFGHGHWLKSHGYVSPEDIVSITPCTKAMVKRVVAAA